MAIAVCFLFFEKQAEAKTFSFPGVTNSNSILEEAGAMTESASSDWWLSSGGIMIYSPQEFSTNLGQLLKDSFWQKLYVRDNPEDTDGGYRPQNIFRLVTRSKWQNFVQQVYFLVDNLNLSESENRDCHNGILFFNRYQDANNLYYTGIRVDGHVVIKKKIGGKYYTLAEKTILKNERRYDRTNNANLIPLSKWIGIRSEVKNVGNNIVSIKLYLDLCGNGNWNLVLEATDASNPFLDAGRAGIRTDFMDVRFRGYGLEE